MKQKRCLLLLLSNIITILFNFTMIDAYFIYNIIKNSECLCQILLHKIAINYYFFHLQILIQFLFLNLSIRQEYKLQKITPIQNSRVFRYPHMAIISISKLL